MNNIEQTIQNHFEQPEIQNSLNEIVNKYFVDENQKKVFVDVFELIKKGEFDVNVLYDYLDDWTDIGIEQANKIDEELFDKIYGDIYDELQELYKIKSQTNQEVKIGNEVGSEEKESDAQEKLISEYKEFSNSSLFQNILAKQEEYSQKINAENLSKDTSLKNDFYGAINSGDKIKTVAILRLVCELGKLQQFFANDKRFVDFWSGVLGRHKGDSAKQEFISNPIDKKYLTEFLRFIFERRLSLQANESAMLGVGLSSLCSTANETEYAEIAYGDEVSGKFMWDA